MKLKLGFIGAFIFASLFSFSSEVLVLEGKYQSKNIYVSNSLLNDGVGFCTIAVRINGDVTTDAINSTAFEIDLSAHGLKSGDDITIAIEHEKGCAPKVLNPGVIMPAPTFTTKDLTITEEGLLEWTTEGETGSLPYEVEQFKWNKWIKVGEVQGEGTAGEHKYSFQANLPSGQVKLRVVQKNLSGAVKRSKAVEVTSNKSKPEFKFEKRDRKVIFTEKTSFEVFDMYGQIRKRGFATEIDFSNLENGDYYVNFDNSMQKIRIK